MPVGSEVSRFLFATDLDGCLLDATTYSFEAARPALSLLAEKRIPLVLASSKTRAEMAPLARTLRLATPLIVENGGAVLVPEREFANRPRGAMRQAGFWALVLGTPHEKIVEALDSIARETGARVRSFSRLGSSEVQRLTGLTPAGAALALEREYDEPFLLDDEGPLEAMTHAARKRGLRVTRGGRFWHLTGENDKGHALRALLRLYAIEGLEFSTVGLGDAANDLTMLQAVDRPIVVPRGLGELDPVLRAALPHAERAPTPGPSGWNATVLAVLSGETLAPVEPGE
jgi:mannosyl-3-phosphoglycerate phosphatase